MKSKTVIIDIDGVIFKHLGEGAWKQWSTPPTPCTGVVAFFDELESESAHIILMTARKESERELLTYMLRNMGIFYDQLIMGVGHGTRYLINDTKPDGALSAVALNVERNGNVYEAWCRIGRGRSKTSPEQGTSSY